MFMIYKYLNDIYQLMLSEIIPPPKVNE